MHEPWASVSQSTPGDYWLHVCEGRRAASAFLMASEGQDLEAIMTSFPILALPEFPDAMLALARDADTQRTGQAWLVQATALRKMHARWRERSGRMSAGLLNECAKVLSQEAQGDRKTNLSRCIGLHLEAANLFDVVDGKAFCLFLAGQGHAVLAAEGIDVRANLEAAVELLSQAQALGGTGHPAYSVCSDSLEKARRSLAALGNDATQLPSESVASQPPAGFDDALARLEQESGLALHVLNVFAMLASEPIPQQVIDLTVEVLSVHLEAAELRQKYPSMSEAQVMDRVNAGENPDSGVVVRTLQRLSLVTVEGETVLVSADVRSAALDRIPDRGKSGLAGMVLYVMDDAWPEDCTDQSTWSECSTLISHAQAAVMNAQAFGVEQGRIGALLRKVDLYLRSRAEGGLKSGDPQGAKEYAAYLFAHGVYDGAATNLERVVQMTEQRRGPQSPDLVDPLLELAAAQLQAGQLTEAEQHGRRACKLAEDCLGDGDPKTALAMSAQARILREAKQTEQAEELMRRALDIGLSTLGRRHPQIATYANSLAQILQDQGDLEGAEGAYKLAIEVDSACRGPEDIEIANSLNDLASCYEDGGKYAEAKEAIDRAVRIFARDLPAGHPDLARAQDRQKRVNEALRLAPPDQPPDQPPKSSWWRRMMG